MSNTEKMINALAQLAVAEDSGTADAAKAEIRALIGGAEPKVQKEKKPDIGAELAIRNILTELGMPEHIKGFRYTLEAIRLCVEDETMIDMVTKRLYPEVAKKYDTTPSRVERVIRHGIELVWERCSLDVQHEYFGYSVDPSKGKTTNSEFIAKVASIVRLQLLASA